MSMAVYRRHCMWSSKAHLHRHFRFVFLGAFVLVGDKKMFCITFCQKKKEAGPPMCNCEWFQFYFYVNFRCLFFNDGFHFYWFILVAVGETSVCGMVWYRF